MSIAAKKAGRLLVNNLRTHLLFSLIWLMGLSGCGTVSQQAGPKLTDTLLSCNGSPQLCDKKLTEITLLGSHNSYSNEAEGWQIPNQQVGLKQQLEDGVRYMALDVHDQSGSVMLCHTYCHLGQELFVSGLLKIADFLQKNPGEVMVINLESYVSGAAVQQALRQAGLLNMLHAPTPGAPWPTLRQMVGTNRRIVLLTGRDAGVFEGFLETGGFYVGNGWGFKAIEDISCGDSTPPLGNRLYGLNLQYVNTFGIPTKAYAAQLNQREVVLDIVNRCTADKQHRVNVVEFDFYNIGDGARVVRELNGVTEKRGGKKGKGN